MRLLLKLIPPSIDPIRAIEWVIAVFTLAGGLYIFTPLYGVSVSQNGLSVLASTLVHPFMVLLFGAVLIVSSLLVMYGLWKRMPQLKSAGWFAIFMARFFQLLTTFIVVGPLPITWIYPMTLTVIIILLWAFARAEVKGNV